MEGGVFVYMHAKGRETQRQKICLRAFLLRVGNPKSDEIIK